MKWQITDKLIQFTSIIGGLIAAIVLGFSGILDGAAVVAIITLVVVKSFGERQNGNLKKENDKLKEEMKTNGST